MSQRTHGMTKTRLYRIWVNLKSRCYNPNFPGYGDYGGRGVKMFEGWCKSFETFLRDVGHPPSESHSLDRFPDRGGDYVPGNVRWATPTAQQRNRRNNVIYTHEGVSCTLAEWSERIGVPYKTLHAWRMQGVQSVAGFMIRAARYLRPGRSKSYDPARTLYQTWKGIKQRCCNPKASNFANYGGIGVTICPAWADSFDVFRDAVGLPPGPGFSLDRYPDRKGNYEPNNVRWATRSTQGRNKSNNSTIQIGTVSRLVVEWTESEGASPAILRRWKKMTSGDPVKMQALLDRYRRRKRSDQ